nr:MAG TPA: hypothetical protein [Crassvirales sp.]DAO31328.1 MAG TPA: hypothetical protein [Crassvirales sp.]
MLINIIYIIYFINILINCLIKKVIKLIQFKSRSLNLTQFY